MRLNKINIIDIAFVSGILVLLVGVSLVVFKPQMQRKALLDHRERILRRQLDLRPQVRAGLDQARSEVDEIERQLAMFNRQMPLDEQLDIYLRQIDDVAKRTGFDVILIKPGILQHATLYSQLSLVLTAESAFPAFYRFLSELYDIPRLTKIEGLSITRKKHSNICDITLTLLIYVAKTNDASIGD